MNDLQFCKPHNWIYDEFNESCPLCEAAYVERAKILDQLNEAIDATSIGSFDAHLVLKSLADKIQHDD